MKPDIKRITFVALLVYMMPLLLGAQALTSTQTCMSREWSAPRLLDEGTAPPFEITFPSIAGSERGDLYIVGRGPDIWTDSSVHVELPFVALVIHPDGKTTRLSKPPFAGEFFAPRIVMADDKLHVFWGEPDSTDAAPQPRARYKSSVPVVRGIWTSTYDGTWSIPRFVTARLNTNWQLATGRARYDWAPSVSLAFASISSHRWVINWIGVDGTATPIGDLDVKTVPLYTTLMSPAPAHLVLGYIGNDPSLPGDKNSVFAIRSTDGGRSWAAPVRIAESGQQPGSDLTIVQNPDGRLHAVWAHNTAGKTFGAQEVGYSTSSDKGKTWSAPQYWKAGDTFLNLKAVADSHDGVHIVFQTTLADGMWPTLVYTFRTATSQWAKPVRLFGDTLPVRAPELARTASDDLVLLFAERIGKHGRFPVFASAVSYLRDESPCTASP